MTDGQSASDRIANAPRAWALIEQPGDTPSAGDLFDSERDARQDLECYPHGRVVPIALVELTEEEAGK